VPLAPFGTSIKYLHTQPAKDFVKADSNCAINFSLTDSTGIALTTPWSEVIQIDNYGHLTFNEASYDGVVFHGQVIGQIEG
jgi:hypothetical protein